MARIKPSGSRGQTRFRSHRGETRDGKRVVDLGGADFQIMTDPEQISAFAADLQSVIDRYRAEFNLTLAAAIGTLEVVKLELFRTESDHE